MKKKRLKYFNERRLTSHWPYPIKVCSKQGNTYGNTKLYIDYSKLFERGLQKKVKMFYDALDWQDPVDSQTSLERFF